MEAGHPEGWEMERRLAADRRAFEHPERDGHYLGAVLAPSIPQSWGKQIDRHYHHSESLRQTVDQALISVLSSFSSFS